MHADLLRRSGHRSRRVFATALVATVVLVAAPAAAASYRSTVLADMPAGYWRLDETTGSTAADSSGHGADGTYYGIFDLGSAGHVDGGNGALDLPGTDESVQAPGGVLTTALAGAANSGSFSLEAWISTPYQDAGSLFERSDGLGWDWALTVSRNLGRLGATELQLNDGCSLFTAYGGPVDDGGWHHVVAVKAPAGVTIYVDGVGTTTSFPKLKPARCADRPTSSSAPVRIAGGFVGTVDDAAVFAVALSAAQVQAHYLAGGAVAAAVADADLTAQQAATAKQLALQDTRIQALLAGHAVSVSEIDPWTTGAGTLIGASVLLRWPDDAAFAPYDWPTVTWDDLETSSPPYATGTDHYGATGARELDVQIDFAAGKVVGFEPGPDAVVDNAGTGTPQPPADGGDPTTRHLRPVFIGPDSIFNYDFNHEVVSANGIDMPVNLIFWGDADVNAVKYLGSGWGECGLLTCGPMHAFLADDNVYNWDSDRGAMKGWICHGTKHHFRPYSAPADRMFNTKYGYFVVATSHIDHNDGCPGRWSGWSENEEMDVANDAAKMFGPAAVKRNAVNLYNPEGHKIVEDNGTVIWASREDGNHYYQSNGFATKIRVCQTSDGVLTKCP
jgi:hypothetical protein